MLSSLLSVQSKKRTQVVSIDLGQRATKAVFVQKKGTGLDLVHYALKDAPVFEKGFTPELLAEHLQSIVADLGYKGKNACLVIGVQDSLIRTAEMPFVPVTDMRLMLKFNSKNYLQQDLPDYVFDCQTQSVGQGGVATETPTKATKAKVLVGGAKQQTLTQLQEAGKLAGLVVDQIIPSVVCPANAFELAQPEHFSKGVVALVDIGFKHSTISILSSGEFTLSRVVSIGADKLTAGLAEAMGVSYAEAESIKVGLPEEVQGIMQSLITPLGRELRASIDFFEHQHDKSVSNVFISGGSSRAQFVADSLQSELMVPTKAWNPVEFMSLSLPPEKLGEIEQVASQLAVAVGGAVAAL